VGTRVRPFAQGAVDQQFGVGIENIEHQKGDRHCLHEALADFLSSQALLEDAER
jgi:hypothetical protein